MVQKDDMWKNTTEMIEDRDHYFPIGESSSNTSTPTPSNRGEID
jgi:hypothetical protein